MIEGLLRPQHIMVILLVTFFLFGGKKLPELGKGLGEGIRSFKESLKNITAPDPDPKEPVKVNGA